MKRFSIHALLLGIYAVALGMCTWFEGELFLIIPGILPVLLFTLVRVLDHRLEKREWSRTPTG